MTPVERIHVKVKQKGNKIDSNHYKDLPPAFIDDYIYEASFDYVELFYSTKNYKRYNLGFETNNQRIDMLEFLIVPELELTTVPTTHNDFSLSIFTLPNNYFHRVREIAVTDCGTLSIEVVQHEDLDSILSDAYRKPSNRWKRGVAVYKNNSIYLYTEDPISSIKIDYIRKPTKTFIGGYDTLEFINGDLTYPSSASAKIDSDFPEQYIDILVDIVIQNIFGDMKDYNESSYRQQKVINKTF